MPYVQEALRWLPPDRASAAPRAAAAADGGVAGARVLVADDNADMREYMTRLLARPLVGGRGGGRRDGARRRTSQRRPTSSWRT